MARTQTNLSYPDEILSLPMFHPEVCCRDKAERYVIQHSKGHGSYIVRPNTEKDPSFVSITISMMGASVSNVRVFIEGKNGAYKYYILEKYKFSSFKELLAHYCEHRIHCLQGIDNLRLLLPLKREIEQTQKWRSSNSLGEDSRVSKETSNLDDVPQGTVNTGKITGRNKTRSNSEPQVVTQHIKLDGMNKLKGSLNSPIFARSGSSLIKPSPKGHLQSADLSNDTKDDLFSKYANSSSLKHDPKTLMQCRPPVPLPRCESVSSVDKFYYSSIEVNKNFFPETYEFLKENEHCECGLLLEDSLLPLGWTIHCSQNPASLKCVFFQHGEVTTWEMPEEIIGKLTTKQIHFILSLYRESQQAIPDCLRKCLDRILGRKKTTGAASSQREAIIPSLPSSRSICYTNTSSNQANFSSSSTDVKYATASLSQNSKAAGDSSAKGSLKNLSYEAPEKLLGSTTVRSDLALPLFSQESNHRQGVVRVFHDSVLDKSRPPSFDSIPTRTIPAKAGSPTTPSSGIISSNKSVH